MCQPGSSSQIATHALKWMVVSRRPLALNELIAAAKLDPATAVDSTTQAPALTLDIDLLIHLCGGLLLWDKQLDVIRFSHLSVQEYLETELMNQYWDIIDAQSLVMEACLWILQCPYRPESNPLYPYAALHWFHHCRSYQDLVVQAASNKPPKHTLDVQLLRNFLPSFHEPSESYKKWVRSLSTHRSAIEEWGFYEYQYLTNLPVCPIFVAAFSGLGKLVSWLWLAEGIDIHATDNARTPLLQYAIVSGNAELVDWMITMGANIYSKNSAHETALAVAAQFGDPKIVSILLDRGADINVVGCKYGTALGCAARRGKVEVVSLLLERGVGINVIGDDYGTPLAYAASMGNVELVSLLLDQGANINVVSGYYGTALGCATARENVEMVLLLLKRGADINVVSGHYGTVLGCAIATENVEMVSVLLEQGAGINVVGGDYGTALGCAVSRGNVQLVSLLLERGADINVVGGKYGSAFGCAVWRGNIEMVALLLEHKADINVVDNDGMTAHNLAERNGHLHIARFLDSWAGGLSRAEGQLVISPKRSYDWGAICNPSSRITDLDPDITSTLKEKFVYERGSKVLKGRE